MWTSPVRCAASTSGVSGRCRTSEAGRPCASRRRRRASIPTCRCGCSPSARRRRHVVRRTMRHRTRPWPAKRNARPPDPVPCRTTLPGCHERSSLRVGQLEELAQAGVLGPQTLQLGLQIAHGVNPACSEPRGPAPITPRLTAGPTAEEADRSRNSVGLADSFLGASCHRGTEGICACEELLQVAQRLGCGLFGCLRRREAAAWSRRDQGSRSQPAVGRCHVRPCR